MKCNKLQLIRGDEVLGTVEVLSKKCDFPWYGGTFTPDDAFAQVKPLFDEELRLLNAGDEGLDGFDLIWQKIDAPGLILRTEDGTKAIKNVLIHIDGTNTWWR